MDRLQELFYFYTNNDRNKGNFENKASIAAWDKCASIIENLPDDIQVAISDSINDYGRTREELGFINGFIYQFEIMSACMRKRNKR